MRVEPRIIALIREEQGRAEYLQLVRQELGKDENRNFRVSESGILEFNGRICVPGEEEMKQQLLSEAHCRTPLCFPTEGAARGSNAMRSFNIKNGVAAHLFLSCFV